MLHWLLFLFADTKPKRQGYQEIKKGLSQCTKYSKAVMQRCF